MFHRGYISQKKGLLKQRRSRKKNPALALPEWDGTVHDLTVHAASPEEILRKRLRRKSKNADAARRELKAKKHGIPADLMLSPGQVELEMRKLAVLREVLYDHNDLNEVLRRTDHTMSSVKDIFHDATTRKSGNMNITLAPGKRSDPPVTAPVEHPSKLDALSDSVMDSHALNEELSSEESEYEDDVQFESKMDCNRFLGLLKDSMNKVPAGNAEEVMKTPEQSRPAGGQERAALNCTEEVKRTLSRISSIHNDETNSVATNESKLGKQPSEIRKIDRTIAGISKDAAKLQKNLNNSAASTIKLTTVPPRANFDTCNMTYDNLKDAVTRVQKGVAELDERDGRKPTSQAASTDGLAGFTATLIDAVTRLTGYVNEGELKHQKLAETMCGLKEKLDHQVALSDALTLELMKTQKQLVEENERRCVLEQKLSKRLDDSEQIWQKNASELKKRMDDMSQKMEHFQKRPGKICSTENPTTNGVDSSAPLLEGITEVNNDVTGATDADDSALKMDMLKLLTALKKENSQKPSPDVQVIMQTRTALPSGLLPPSTQEAAETIASVESHLRHLKLQHAQACNRMTDLTRHAQLYGASSCEPSGTTSGDCSERHPRVLDVDSTASSPSAGTSLASLPTKLVLTRPKPVAVQTNFSSYAALRPFSMSPPSQDVSTEQGPTPVPDKTSLAFSDSDAESFHFLERDSIDTDSAPSADSHPASQPHVAKPQLAMLSNIQKAQMSLEDRISELNKQHSEAQKRLQNLVARRRNEPSKRIQVSIPTAEMLQTPKVSKTGQTADSLADLSSWTSLLQS